MATRNQGRRGSKVAARPAPDTPAATAIRASRPSGPSEYRWQAHARGFVGHLAFGLVAGIALDVLDRAA